MKARYTYDAWGNVTSVKDANGADITDEFNIGNINPIRYRGYYYDTDTKLYYLQSRYYDSVNGRFLNADGIMGAPGDLTGENLFAYCRNNPVNKTDSTGLWCPQGDGTNEHHNKDFGWINGTPEPVVTSGSTSSGGSSQSRGTVSVGICGSAAFGINISGSIGITADKNGNIGIIITGCAGGGTPSASASVYKTVTTAPDIYKQRGWSTQIGGSVDLSGVNVGAEYSFFTDSDTNKIYHSGTVLAGVGAPIPVELHGEIGYSYVYGFNVYDIMENIYIKIME